ncbi:unnamed protein product [Adineta steineri]|uniref:Cobalamin adenosyltransferase-like domain-containing protein n=1 Tax=Adineta steineri TaxID=433720 RepID=A0A815C0N0_9BILA|nr:unnamed protein product [Adineta steineri]CAF1280427.1 unnamed protein product [Adineta steineri]CAF3621886.1 unnamed protein product [Adineta steineri]CAF3876686.1 unnamed protein product [Adineta steineri]
MFRLSFTHFIATSRIVINSSTRSFQRLSSPSNENIILSTTLTGNINIDDLYGFKNCIQKRQLTNTVNIEHDKNATIHKSSQLPKVYTRTGDRGTSALLGSGSNRVSKDSLIFDVLGTIDELSATLGIVLSTCLFPELTKELENIQCRLFEIGSCVAANNRSSRFTFNDSILINNLEEQIDKMTNELPALRHFILPGGGSQTGSNLHFSRAVCRRCERLLTKWSNNQNTEEEEQQDTIMGIYLNRLSDYLFTLARYITFKEGHKEIIYQKNK